MARQEESAESGVASGVRGEKWMVPGGRKRGMALGEALRPGRGPWELGGPCGKGSRSFGWSHLFLVTGSLVGTISYVETRSRVGKADVFNSVSGRGGAGGRLLGC